MIRYIATLVVAALLLTVSGYARASQEWCCSSVGALGQGHNCVKFDPNLPECNNPYGDYDFTVFAYTTDASPPPGYANGVAIWASTFDQPQPYTDQPGYNAWWDTGHGVHSQWFRIGAINRDTSQPIKVCYSTNAAFNMPKAWLELQQNYSGYGPMTRYDHVSWSNCFTVPCPAPTQSQVCGSQTCGPASSACGGENITCGGGPDNGCYPYTDPKTGYVYHAQCKSTADNPALHCISTAPNPVPAMSMRASATLFVVFGMIGVGVIYGGVRRRESRRRSG